MKQKPRRFWRASAMLATSLATFSPQGFAKAATEMKEKKVRSIASRSGGRLTPVAGAEPPPTRKESVGSLQQPAASVTTSAVSLKTPVTSLPVTLSRPPEWTRPLESKITPPSTITAPRSTPATKYPWKTSIVTTTFWVGENAAQNNPVPNYASSWDPNWMQSYGGVDTPVRGERADFLPVAFTPQQNPFYVALPYNDVTSKGHKPEAARMIPWFKEAFQVPGKTVLKGRWVAIRFGNRVAYAQWEDCGPFRTDHAEYVFGNERPKPNLNKGAGLDVSPAVRDYLGMADTDVTDWRFVDFSEVPTGPWATHGENNTFVQQKRAEETRVASAKTNESRQTSMP
jgi:hypothetical protein